MQQLINLSLAIGKKKLTSHGFSDEQVAQLLQTAKEDLHKEFGRLQDLLQRDCSVEELNQSLHALKGLLLNLGNEKLAKRFIEIKDNMDIDEKKVTLHKLLFE